MCNSCHRVIDPLGLALENFDVDGAWRIKDNGVRVDASGVLYDGTKSGRAGGSARQALLNHSDVRHPELHREPDGLRARPPRRVLRPADDPLDRAERRPRNGNRFSSFVLGIVNSPAFQMSTAETADHEWPSRTPRGFRERIDEVAMNVHFEEASFPAHGSEGHGRDRRRCRCSTRWCRRGRRSPRRPPRHRRRRHGCVCMEMVHGSAGSTRIGRQENLFAPAKVGRRLRLESDSLEPLAPFREYVTIVSNTDVHNAEAFTLPEIGGDHFRSSAVFLTQSHPKQTEGIDVLRRHVARSALRARVRPGHADSVDAALDRERRSGRRLRLRLLLRLHRHDQLGGARPSRCRWCAIRAWCSTSCSASA